MLQAYIDRYKENTLALDENGKSIFYGDIDVLSKRLKAINQSKPLVFCLSENSLGSLLGYLSFICNGWVPLMLDKNIDVDFFTSLMEKYKPTYIWQPVSTLNKTGKEKTALNANGYVLTELEQQQPTVVNKQLSLLLTTSGSTGSPKLVRISLENIIENAKSIAAYLEITSKERPITTLPMYYSYGLSVIHSHVISGATILLTNRSLMEKDFWNFLKQKEATSFAGVPYTFEMLHRLRFERMQLPSIKTITQAGGKLNEKLVSYFSNTCFSRQQRFFVMYGQTEATARMSYLPFELALESPTSIGISIPGGKFTIIDSTGSKILENNVAGELCYEGPNVSMGYAESAEDLLKGDENKGILYTGDIAICDEKGLYYIVGRKKRFIKIFGNRVSLDATEQLLKEITSEVACIGSDDKMVIFITDPQKVEEVKSYVSHKTGIHISAFKVELVDKLPKNSSGKIMYSNLQQ